jgi:amino acid transporter
MLTKLKRLILGAPQDVEDPQVFHRISLVAFLAWIGLGADGLSSSCYGPEESFRALGSNHYLLVLVAIAVALSIFTISYAYSRVIEHFPFGGGGYVVATRLLGPSYGIVSGSALLIDYILTITTSIAAGTDAFFSFLPLSYQPWKFPLEFAIIGFLAGLNLRGVKESVEAMMPVFLLFLATHAVLIFGTIILKLGALPAVAHEVNTGFHTGMATIGFMGIAALFLRSYSMGAGTYTGLEAVSNGLSIMREPKVETGKKTMTYMAVSLAVTAGGILLAYLLAHAEPMPGQTMNAVLAARFVSMTGLPPSWGQWFTIPTLLSEAALLCVAAQTGFIDGPRVMANMAHDSWLPHRFSTLSDRLTTQDGIFLISAAAALMLLYSRGSTETLVLMYAINVFITFSLTEASMIRFWIHGRDVHKDWHKKISVHIIGFCLCFSILVINTIEKFTQGGWVTLATTAALIGLCFLIKRHYVSIQKNFSRLDDILTHLPPTELKTIPVLDPQAPTAVVLVGGYGGLGVHCILGIQRLFPNYFKNFIFMSIGVVDTASFKGVQGVEEVRRRTEESLKRYTALAKNWGLASDYRIGLGTEVVSEAEKICLTLAKEYPRAIIFAGKLIFQNEHWFHRILHNETAYQMQKKFQFLGLNSMVLPVRILSEPAA